MKQGHEAQPRPGWTVAKVTGWPTQRGFSLRLPAGWEINELQSVDPYAAEVIGDGVRLALQYGELSRDLNPADDSVHDYTVLYHECCQSAKVGQIGTREDYCYEELRVSSLRVLL